MAHVNVSFHTFEWVMSRIWMRHDSHVKESCLTSKCVETHVWMSHVWHVNDRIWISHVALQHTATHCNTLQHTLQHTAAHCTHLIWMSHVTIRLYKSKHTHVNESCGEVGGWGRDPKNVRGEIGGWGRVPFNEPYAPSLSTIYDGA